VYRSSAPAGADDATEDDDTPSGTRKTRTTKTTNTDGDA
jgi:hypothetical protein